MTSFIKQLITYVGIFIYGPYNMDNLKQEQKLPYQKYNMRKNLNTAFLKNAIFFNRK